MKKITIKKRRDKGMIFMIVLVMITLVGSYVAILAGISNNLVTETNIAYLNACKKNMTKSAITFATKTPNRILNETAELNIAEMGKCCKSLKIIPESASTSILQVEGLCQSATQKMSIKETFKIHN